MATRLRPGPAPRDAAPLAFALTRRSSRPEAPAALAPDANHAMQPRSGTRRSSRDSYQSAMDRAWVAGWAAKLLVLPLVTASLCGALTLMLGVHWLEALVTSTTEAGDGGERHEPARSPSSRPMKRQRSDNGDAQDGNDGDEALLPRQPKPSSPLTGLDERLNALDGGTKTRRRRRKVFIWDLDETLVLFASLYTGAFAQTHGKEVAPGVALGEQMMTFLLAMLERHFFFNDLHDADVDHIDCAEGDRCTNCRRLRSASAAAAMDSPTLSSATAENELKARYRRIREIYEQRGHVDFLHDDQSDWFAVRAALVQAIDSFSTGWLQEARHVLSLIELSSTDKTAATHRLRDFGSSSTLSVGEDEDDQAEEPVQELEDDNGEEVENINVLVTNTQLVPALCKCLVYQLDAFFPIGQVYSSAKVHKYRCFESIVAKYTAEAVKEDLGGDSATVVEFVAIGDGLEEEQVSLALGLEFHKIRSIVDLKRLRYDLKLGESVPDVVGAYDP